MAPVPRVPASRRLVRSNRKIKTKAKRNRKQQHKPPKCPQRNGLPFHQLVAPQHETDGHFNNSKEGEHNKIPTSHRKKHGHDVVPACKGVLIQHSGLTVPARISDSRQDYAASQFSVTVGAPAHLHASRSWQFALQLTPSLFSH